VIVSIGGHLSLQYETPRIRLVGHFTFVTKGRPGGETSESTNVVAHDGAKDDTLEGETAETGATTGQ
jgi:hypothetical protein